jgi:hypothetical protein
MMVLPFTFIVYQWRVLSMPLNWALAGKWLLFWSVGCRLFVTGLRQATKPAFTARQIFHFTTTESYPVITELGFANICLGLIAMLSLIKPAWRAPAAIAGGLYFGLAGMMHVVKKPVSTNEVIALISDLYIAFIMGFYLFSVL